MIWLWGLSVGVLLLTVLGVVFATQRQRRDRRGTGGSVTDWGQNLALVHELRRDIKRLNEENRQLWEERAELAKVFARVVELLQQEAGQISRNASRPQ